MTDYKVKSLGTQYTAMYSLEDDFIEQFAPSRTFCLFSEIIELNNLGLIKGGSMDNAVIFVDKKMKETGMGSLPDVNRDPELNARPSPELAAFKSSFGIYRKTLLGNKNA